MFFCDSCAKARSWPNSIMKSGGRCELCKKPASCNDVPSKYLPIPMPAVKPEYQAKHRKKS